MSRKRAWNLMLGVLLAATICFIWCNSFLSREDSTKLSMGLWRRLAPVLQTLKLAWIDEHFLRKLAHFGEFFLLGCELAALFLLNCGRRYHSVLYSALSALFVAAADEIIQFFSGRAAMFKDVLLDLAGAFMGISLFFLWIHLRKQSRKSDQK